MHPSRRSLAAPLAFALALFAAPPLALAQDRASGEYSRSAAAAAQTWKLTRPARSPAPVRLQYGEVSAERLYAIQRKNAARTPKAVQIGLPRRADLESRQRGLPPLQWTPLGRDWVARLEIRSPIALALRVGLQIDRLDDRVELRFAGSDAPQRVVAMIRGDDVKHLSDAQRLFWTPSTDGETQIIEIFRPGAVPASAVRLQAPQLSHLIANSRNDFKLIAKIGESGSCNVDTACRLAELGPRFADAKNAVAHMQFVKHGATFICSGTLLADTTPGTQVPYFYGAHHCFTEDANVPVASRMQAVADTLNTFWNYEATACGNGVSAPTAQLSGGATYLYSDHRTDGMLLRLNEPAPAGAYFAGWNAGSLPSESAILGIHHPSGDAKKVSSGRHRSSDGFLHRVGWLSGTTEGGSSGSALFTLGGDGYVLRGGLYGGRASCANSGSLDNENNWDVYSRFDVLFPNVRSYLAADPVPLNGAQPLLPPRPAATVTTTSASATTAAPAPRLRLRTERTQQRRTMREFVR